jgi:hypothetical protein
MRNLLLMLITGMLSTACSHMKQQGMTAKDLSDLRNQTVVQTIAPAPFFSTLRPSLTALITGLDLRNEDHLIRNAGIVDPAVSISATLAASLAASNGARMLPQPISVTSAEVGHIADAARSSARYVLDVRSLSWMLSYLPLAWNSYGLTYSASARLIDTQTNTVLAQGYCNQSFDKTVNPPSYDAMTTNQAARLKRELDLTAEECTRIFSTQMALAMPGAMVRPLAQQAPPAPAELRKPVNTRPAAAVAPAPQPFVLLVQ